MLNYNISNLNNNKILYSTFYSWLNELISNELNINDCKLNLHLIEDNQFNNLKILREFYYNYDIIDGTNKTIPPRDKY